VCCGYLKNVRSELIIHRKKAVDVCYQGKKLKMNLDVGFRSSKIFFHKINLIDARALMGLLATAALWVRIQTSLKNIK
jgi:Holliday junction resolvase-like predicted endonuclease